jgi:hypothetical protein
METWKLLFCSLEVITAYNLNMSLYQSIECKTFLNLTLPVFECYICVTVNLAVGYIWCFKFFKKLNLIQKF